MLAISFLIFLIPLILSSPFTYYGIRTAKSLNSTLKDSLLFYKQINKKLINIEIPDITEINGDWWNRVTLKYTNIKAGAFDFSPKRLKVGKITMLPTGTFEAVLFGDALYWDLKFDWRFSLSVFNIDYTARVMLVSKKILFRQSYSHGITNTNVNVEWEAPSIKLGGVDIDFIRNWLLSSMERKLYPKLTMLINTNLNPIVDNVQKPYENITTDGILIITNKVISAYRGVCLPVDKEEKDFVVMNYDTTFTAPNGERMEMKGRSDSKFHTYDDTLDYEVCYSMNLFVDYADFLVKSGYNIFKNWNRTDYPMYVGYYKAIVRNLDKRYPDDEKVDIIFKGDPTRSHMYLQNNSFLIPIITEFRTASDNSLFLTFKSTYKAKGSLTDMNCKVKGKFINAVIDNLETVPVVDFPVRLIVLSLANSMSAIINNHNIIGYEGILKNTVRADNYKYSLTMVSPEEICVQYIDTLKLQDF